MALRARCQAPFRSTCWPGRQGIGSRERSGECGRRQIPEKAPQSVGHPDHSHPCSQYGLKAALRLRRIPFLAASSSGSFLGGVAARNAAELQRCESASTSSPPCGRPSTMPSRARLRSMIAEMRVATWCVGGIKARLKYLCHWLASRKPDVVALQKPLAATDKFPADALRQAGYESVFYSRDGESNNGWGVAVLSRMNGPKPEVMQRGLPGQRDRGARLLTVRTGDLEFSSVYAPYGNPKKLGFDGALKRKIEWLKLLHKHLGRRSTRPERCVLAGDFNVVSDGGPVPGILGLTKEEREELDRILGLGFRDLYRLRHSRGRDGYNYGFNIHNPVSARLHRILGSCDVAHRLREACVDLEYRKEIPELPGCKWAQGAPVIVDLSCE